MDYVIIASRNTFLLFCLVKTGKQNSVLTLLNVIMEKTAHYLDHYKTYNNIKGSFKNYERIQEDKELCLFCVTRCGWGSEHCLSKLRFKTF